MTEVKTSGRKAMAPAEKVGPDFIGKTPEEDSQQLEELRVRQNALVEQFGDGLPWHPDHYEAAIRGELRRGCESFLRAGRYLMVARECAAHGEWGGMLDRLGMEPRQAHRMMEAARRVASLPNRSTSTDLIAAVKSESKLIELLSLPEDQFKELAEVGETGDLALDDIVTMSVRELRQQVREARADIEAKNQRISQLSENLNKEHEKTAKAQRKWKQATPDEQQLMLEHAVTDAEAAILADLGSAKNGLLAAVVALGEHCDENNLDCTAFLGDVFGRLLNAVRTVRDHNLVPVAIPLVHDAGAEG